MGSPALGMPFSNNAPQPIPGGYGNPAGMALPGMSKGAGGSGASPFSGLSFNAFGPPTTPSANAGPWGGTDFAGLNSGIHTTNPALGGNLYREFERAYGKGTADILSNIFGKGLFNPDVAAAFLNAQQPGISRGQADIMGAFGAGGSRFGSSAALGLGDYMSQVNLNQQSTLAQMFQHGQDQEMGLLQQLLPTLHTEQANQAGGGLWSKIMGAVAPLAGLIPGVGPLLSAGMKGVSSIFGGQSSSGQQSGGDFGSLASMIQGMINQNKLSGSPTEISGNFGGPTEVPTISSSLPDLLSMDAGNIWNTGGGGDMSLGNLGLEF